MCTITEILDREVPNHITVRELARIAECAESTVYSVKADENEFRMNQIARISRELSRRGRLDMARQFIAPEWTIIPAGNGKANGKIDDEITRITRLMGKLIDSFDERNAVTFNDTMSELRSEINNLTAEGDRL